MGKQQFLIKRRAAIKALVLAIGGTFIASKNLLSAPGRIYQGTRIRFVAPTFSADILAVGVPGNPLRPDEAPGEMVVEITGHDIREGDEKFIIAFPEGNQMMFTGRVKDVHHCPSGLKSEAKIEVVSDVIWESEVQRKHQPSS